MKYFKIFPILMTFTLLACGGDKYSDYVGYWESKEVSQFTGDEIVKIAQISQDGDSYLFNDNVMSTKSKPILLTANEGKLSANTGLGAVDFGLSDDKKTLYVANNNYTKIDSSQADKYKQDAEDCKTAQNNYRAELEEHGLTRHMWDEEKQKQKEGIQAKYKSEFERLKPYCKSPF